MSNDAQEIKYTKRDDNVYMFRFPNTITDNQQEKLYKMIKQVLPEGSKCLCLPDGYDYIPPDNEALMKRMDVIEHSLQELISLVDSRTR